MASVNFKARLNHTQRFLVTNHANDSNKLQHSIV